MGPWIAYGTFAGKYTFHCSGFLPWLKEHFTLTAGNSLQTCLLPRCIDGGRKKLVICHALIWSDLPPAEPLPARKKPTQTMKTCNQLIRPKPWMLTKVMWRPRNQTINIRLTDGEKKTHKARGFSCYIVPHRDLQESRETGGKGGLEPVYLSDSVPLFLQCQYDLCWAQHCLCQTTCTSKTPPPQDKYQAFPPGALCK